MEQVGLTSKPDGVFGNSRVEESIIGGRNGKEKIIGSYKLFRGFNKLFNTKVLQQKINKWIIARQVVISEKTRADTLSFGNFKASGMDTAMAKDVKHSKRSLRNIFLACIVLGYLFVES